MSLFSRFLRKAPSPPLTPEKPAGDIQAAPEQSLPGRTLASAREEQALTAAIELRDTETIARLVIEGTSTRVRQLAAQAVEDPGALRQLIKSVRGGNDKTVYKILAHKRDALLAQARKLEQLQAQISAISTAIERHSHRPCDALFGPTLEQLEARWTAVAAQADPETRHNAQRAIERSHEVIAQHLRQIAQEAARQLAAADAAAEARRLREQQEQADAIAAAEHAATLEAQSRSQAEKLQAQALALRQLGGLARKALGALDEGSSGRAAGLRRAIEAKLATAPPLPAYLSNQLQQLDARLNELKDWKSFSVTPKRAELMEEMESLVGSALDPKALAGRIKALQEHWRTLSKGAGESLEADWHRFQEAAHKAYQPCRDYFAAQALARGENLRRREELVARLAAFESGHDWEHPDWRTVSVALRESRQLWRQYSAVDRVPGRALQERFDALTCSVQSRLDAEYARNVKDKRLLIARVQQLLALEDSRQAIEDAKDLQRKWKAVGPVPQAEGRGLWEEFRRHCDALFEKRQRASADYAAALETNKSNAAALCAQIEQIAALTGPGLLEKASTVADLRRAFEAIGEFPRSDARALHNRFERAVERCEQSVAQQCARDIERSWTELLEAADRVRTYRLAVVRNAEPARQDELKRAAESHIACIGRWPKGTREAISGALAKEGAQDLVANEAALRMLCIRAEILTDMPTAPEDQQLRRQYQVQRLVQSMGQGIRADETQMDTLTLEWIGAGPTDDATYAPLLRRFLRCRNSRHAACLAGDPDPTGR